MENKYLTRKRLCQLSGGKFYQINYLLALGKLRLLNSESQRGKPNQYHPDSVEIVKKFIDSSGNSEQSRA